MAWSIRCNFSPIRSYAEADKVWDKAVLFPKSPAGPRGLVDRRKKHLTIERTEAEDILLRLYGSPIVTWHTDNAFTIHGARPTRSTVQFANRCTPNGVYVAGGAYRVGVDGRTYKVGEEITFRQRDGSWKADKTTPWSVPVVNRERAKQARDEIGYDEFRLWFKTYVQMAPKPNGHSSGWLNNEGVVLMLRDRNKWRDLIACRFPNAWTNPDQALSEIRQIIYAECGCVDRKSIPFLG